MAYHITREDREDARAKAMLYKGAYAARVYKNHLIDVLRKERFRDDGDYDIEALSPETRSHEMAVILMALVESLPEQHRDALIAKAQYLDDKEAAEALGISLTAFKSRLTRARRAAQEAFNAAR